MAKKYYWLLLYHNIKTYVWGYNLCLISKTVCHKPYKNLQSLLILTHQWESFLIDFVTSLPLSTDWKGDNYDLILVIVNHLTKIVYYEVVKITIDILELAKVIIIMVMQYYGFPDSIISNRRVIFMSKFWFLL